MKHCTKCGIEYAAGERSRYCPDCRKEVHRQWAKDHKICYAGANARWNRKGENNEGT